MLHLCLLKGEVMSLGTAIRIIPITAFHIKGDPNSDELAMNVMRHGQNQVNLGFKQITCSVKLELLFKMKRIKSMPKKKIISHIKQPTTTRLAESIIDALSLHMLQKKSLIIDLHVKKRYAYIDESVGCDIHLWSKEEA